MARIQYNGAAFVRQWVTELNGNERTPHLVTLSDAVVNDCTRPSCDQTHVPASERHPLFPTLCPTPDGEAVCMAVGNWIQCLDSRTGQIRWAVDLYFPFHGAVVSLLPMGPYLVVGACG